MATAVAFIGFMLAGNFLAMLALGMISLDVGIQAAMNGNQYVWPRRQPVAPTPSTWYHILLVALWAPPAASRGISSAGWTQRLSGLLYSCAAAFVRFAWMSETVPSTLTKGDASSLPSSNSSSPRHQKNWRS